MPRPPEFRLVATACAWPPGAARDGQVRSAAAEVDWPLVPRLARRHRVQGLFWAALSAAGVVPPTATSTDFRHRARQIAQSSLTLAAESLRLQRMLESAGTRALVMKGAAVEMLAYGRLGLKSAWDIDLLVSPAAVPDAMAELTRLGYGISEPAGLSPRQFATWIELAKECELRHEASGVVVELHWRLADGPSLLPGLGPDAPRQAVSIGGDAPLVTFATDELFAYLCVHGALHAWSRLKWLADLGALLSHESPDAVTALWRRSVELGAGHCSAQALLLCRDVLGLPLQPELESELRRSRVVRHLVGVALKTMAGGGAAEIEARPLAATRILLAQLALGGSWRHAWAEFGYRWIGLHDRVHLPLPKGLGVLYPILRLPLWLGRRLGLGRA